MLGIVGHVTAKGLLGLHSSHGLYLSTLQRHIPHLLLMPIFRLVCRKGDASVYTGVDLV